MSAALGVFAERFLDDDAIPTTGGLALGLDFTRCLDKDARRQGHIENTIGTLGFELLSFEQVFVEVLEGRRRVILTGEVVAALVEFSELVTAVLDPENGIEQLKQTFIRRSIGAI